MTALMVCMAVCCGATQVWTASSQTDVFPDDPVPSPRSTAIRLSAARGEYESFQVCIRSSRKGLAQVRVEPSPLDDDIGPPSVRRVAGVSVASHSARAYREDTVWPDVLLPGTPCDVPEEETATFWITYYVPLTAEASVHSGSIRVRWGKHAARDIEVALEVFDFTLPAVPSLPSLFSLDAAPLQKTYELRDAGADTYAPFYNTLEGWRIGVTLKRLQLPAPILQDHLAVLAKPTVPAVVDLAQAGHDLGAYPEPEFGFGEDPLRRYLIELDRWSVGHLPGARPVYALPIPTLRTRWPFVRAQLLRVQGADVRIARLLPGPLHPYFERNADIIAVPFAQADPVAIHRLHAGLSLEDSLYFPPSYTAASSSDPGILTPYATAPDDGYDGSFFTAWRSLGTPSQRYPEWYEVQFPRPITVSAVRLWWNAGYEPHEIRVTTSADGTVFSPATTSWEERWMQMPGLLSESDGTFKVHKIVRAIRFEFRKPTARGPVSLVEMDFGPERRHRPPDTIAPVDVWLHVAANSFPSLDLDADPIEARLLPWVCWGQGLAGILGNELAAWPSAWATARQDAPATWTPIAAPSAPLVYPGPITLLPSVRLERLRDGLEDYEYLVESDRRLSPEERETIPLLHKQPYPPELSKDRLAALGKEIETSRTQMGRALTQAQQGR